MSWPLKISGLNGWFVKMENKKVSEWGPCLEIESLSWDSDRVRSISQELSWLPLHKDQGK